MLGIVRKSWQVIYDRSLLLRSFWSSVLPVLEYCSVVWCSAADSHLELPDRVVRSAGFLAVGVLECNLAHRRSVAELCMLFKIKSNPMHPLSGTLPLCMCLGVSVVVLWLLICTRSCLLVVGLLSIAEPLCHSRCLFETILVTLCLMVWDWRVSRAEPMLSWHDLLFLFCLLLFYIFFLPWVGCVGLGSSDSNHCALLTPVNNNNNNYSSSSKILNNDITDATFQGGYVLSKATVHNMNVAMQSAYTYASYHRTPHHHPIPHKNTFTYLPPAPSVISSLPSLPPPTAAVNIYIFKGATPRRNTASQHCCAVLTNGA